MHPQQPWQGFALAPQTVDADPEGAGLVRVEKFGWAIAFSVLGTVAAVVSLFLTWAEAQFFITYNAGQNGPLTNREERAGLFSVVRTVRDVTAPDPASPDPGIVSVAFFPWGAIVATIVVCLVAAVAAIGLRRSLVSGLVRITGVLLAAAAATLAVIAFWDLGFRPSGSGTDTAGTSTTGRDGPIAFIASAVQPALGSGIWLLGMGLLAIASALGPRIIYVLPEQRDEPRRPRPQQMAPQRPAPQQVAPQRPAPQPHRQQGPAPQQHRQQGPAPQPHRQQGPAHQPHRQQGPAHQPHRQQGPAPQQRPPQQRPLARAQRVPLVWHTQIVAIVVGILGTLLCLAGYGFLPWASGNGETTTFSEIGEAARDQGFGDRPVTEAYFAWLGWAIMLVLVVVAVLLALGRRPTGVNPRVLRPILAALVILGTLAHWWSFMDLASEGADFDIGAYAVWAGLLLTVLAALLPVRPTVRMLVQPR